MKTFHIFMITCLLYNARNIHTADHKKNESIHSSIQFPQKSISHDYSFGIIPLRKINETWQTFIICQNSGRWSFPKGHVESYDPSVLHTAERELCEETGLSVETYLNVLPLSVTYCSNTTGLEKTVTLFCATITGTVQLEKEEAIDGTWINVNEIQNKITASCYKDLIATLQDIVQKL